MELAINATNETLTPAYQYLLTLSNRVLWPVAKGLGGVPDQDLAAAGSTHIGVMPKPALVESLVRNYGLGTVSAMVAQVIERKASQPKTETQLKAQPKTETKTETQPKTDEAAVLAEAIRKIASGSTGVNEDAVKALITEAMDEVEPRLLQAAIEAARASSVQTIRIERQDAPAINVGVQHRNFPLLLKTVACRLPNGRRLNVWLHGPAGTGKTSAAAKCAEALGLRFFFSGAIETAYALMGYTDAHGRLVRTPFRDAWEHGGVFLMDEVDASHPQALAALNAAIDGGVCAFPDGMVKRHEDTVIIAGANTAGRGGDAKYAGRVRQDAAFLSRYVMLSWSRDGALEEALAGNDEAAKTMLRSIHKLRTAATNERIDDAALTTRAILDGAALLRAGIELPQVLEMVAQKGMPQDSWERLLTSAGLKG